MILSTTHTQSLTIHLSRAILVSFILLLAGCSTDGWQTASREPANIAPDPATTPEAVIQFYSADAWGWRGIFAVHTWIAVKPSKATQYTVYEVVGWQVERGLPALKVYQERHPDRYWFGAKPELIWTKQGAGVDQIIDNLQTAVVNYPWKNEYSVFPGPNSNTFPAWIIEHVEGIDAELPFRAIGSGYTDKQE